ncbi:MAG: carboxypeptidase-like regulatory domain-containing protein [Chitinophagaceae bacterium]
MRRRLLYITAFIITLLFATDFSAAGQTYMIRGMVYDSSRNYPLEAVSVLSTSGKGTVTNADGYYEIEVTEKDSIWFSYLNKPTVKFPVLKIANTMSFDISLHVNVPVLREVKIRPRNYRQDSAQNRIDYAKVFNYQKPKLKPSVTSSGVGFDLDEIINMFRFRRNRSMASFQQRLLLEEEDKFIDHRFNKALVRRLTLLESPELDSFMRLYRPSHTFTKMAGDYEFQYYIKTAFFRYKNGLLPEALLKQEEQE